jgi:phosphomannomutase
VLNPIDAEAVIRDGGAVGRFPGEIHEGVAWWLGACFVALTAASRLAVGSDGRPATAEFSRRLCNGAVNAGHHACQVTAVSGITEDAFLGHLRRHQPLAGAYLATEPGTGGATVVRIHLYGEDGLVLQEDTGLALIRRMITDDRVPIPVSDSAKGTIEHLPPAAPESAQ